ncbi:DUF2795 domain-containing protein [Robbsia sp. Bb-Pol-6]|uniref:DUF2795 domain-containing protein n=2 Tax=Robbsia betulipollinis TaxID=2981849 RepID=A0ABT3ZNS0_9BURK|nr:DUF2795 domain-containing protein [Robbsia betulipollinis]MCY0388107.1 DUF2795 domain-containing protein [Robbsia betulipollinis]
MLHPDGQGSPDSISGDIQTALASVSYPSNKDGIVAAATASGVSNEVVAVLNGLPEKDYPDADAVLRQLG